MEKNSDRQVRELKDIKEELVDLKERTAGYPRSFLNGIIYGIGWVVGSIIALALIGWLLSVIGLIPGLGKLSGYIHSAVDQFNAARH